MDTASSAKKVHEERLEDAGVIGNLRAAEVYHLAVIKDDIHDQENNFTRFFGISLEKAQGHGDKTSLYLELRSSLDELYPILGSFVRRKVRILQLGTRPDLSRPFKYIVFLDVAGDYNDDKVKEAVLEVTQICGGLRFFGSYKAGVLHGKKS